MDPARVGVILDSSVLIEAERRGLVVERFLELAAEQLGNTEMALCAISVAELAHGVHRANTAERRESRLGSFWTI
jgi:predicted nucleic acid-binding protein